MHGLVVCSEMEKMLLRMVAGPINHGSMSTVKEPGAHGGEERGMKVSKKAESPLIDFTVKDMAVDKFTERSTRTRREQDGKKTLNGQDQ